MALRYDISKYVTKTKMSSKKRILVEGRDDKSHLVNLLDILDLKKGIKIDTAETINGDCQETQKNNRAKIDKIHFLCNPGGNHKNLFFLRDREFYKFEVQNEISDLMNDHESDGNLSWTLGHSLENYFLEEDLLCSAFRYMCSSEYKAEAVTLFKNIITSAIHEVAAITLSARDIGASSYPCSLIKWNNIKIIDNKLDMNIENCSNNKQEDMADNFIQLYKKYKPISISTEGLICARICRGHTAIVMLQRIFAACLYEVISNESEELATRTANAFSNQKESAISGALSETWLNNIKTGSVNYPENLIRAIS